MVLVVLIPLMVMVVACLLERFEARAVPRESTRRAPRAARAARPRHLALVPGTGVDAALDPETLRLTLPEAS